MKHSMICALCSKDAGKVSAVDIQKDGKTVTVCSSCKTLAENANLQDSSPDRQILQAIRSYGKNGVSYFDMLETPPFAVFARWDMLDYFLEILLLQQKICSIYYPRSGPHYFAKEFTP